MNKLLEEKIAGLPESPGVYIMRDARGGIIYIGKAVVLKNRVRQYFFNTQKQPKVQAMVDNIADFDYIITLSERDALALEANLIKKHKPHYNILLKDDKAFPYIRINVKEDFPAIEITRRVRRDGARYFGPYFNGISVRDVADIVRSAYRLRSCAGRLKSKGRECLNYHINLCLAPCTGRVTKEEYARAVAAAVNFLSGHDDAPAQVIERKMNEAAAAEDFERAIFYRDRLSMLKRMKERTLADLNGVPDIDAFAYHTNGLDSAVSVTLVRGGKLMGVKNYMFTDAAMSEGEALGAFLLQYYGSLGISRYYVRHTNENRRACARNKTKTARYGAQECGRLSGKECGQGAARLRQHGGRERTAQKDSAARLSRPHGVLRYFQHQRHRQGGVAGRVQARGAEQGRLPAV